MLTSLFWGQLRLLWPSSPHIEQTFGFPRRVRETFWPWVKLPCTASIWAHSFLQPILALWSITTDIRAYSWSDISDLCETAPKPRQVATWRNFLCVNIAISVVVLLLPKKPAAEEITLYRCACTNKISERCIPVSWGKCISDNSWTRASFMMSSTLQCWGL